MNNSAITAGQSARPIPTVSGAAPAGFGLVIGAIAALVLLAMLGLQNLATPAAAPAAVPAAEFSSERAMEKLARIAAAPHALGTAENAQVRDYLVAELNKLGAETRVQHALGASARTGAAGYVNNIVARIPGTAPGKALALVAHYDSVPTGFGAADNGASVAAILETVRAMRQGPALKNSLIVLLTDGEEAGLLGAQAFMAGDPWAGEIALALNFEYRGNSGPMLMFQTSAGNGKLVDGFATLARPVGNSLMGEIYKMVPNDTDMSALAQGGLPGMNFAAMERAATYHTQLDRADTINQGSLQHQGATMLGLVKHFGNADLAALKDGDQVYFDFPGLGLVHYPAALALPLALAAALLFGYAVFAGRKASALRLGRVAAAAILLPLTGLVLAIACTLAWFAISAAHPQYQKLLDPYNSHWYWLAFTALGCTLFMLVQGRLQRRFDTMELAMGAALLWVLLAAGTALAVPGASFIFTWPLLPLLAAFGFLLSPRGEKLSERARLMLLLAASAPAVLLFAPFLLLLFTALTTNMVAVPVLMLVLVLGIMTPLLAMLRGRLRMPLLPFVAALAFLVAGSLTAAVSADQPRHNNLIYMFDGMTGKAHWLSADPAPDSWVRGVLGEGAVRGKLPALFGDDSMPYWNAGAPDLGIAAPQMEVLKDETAGAVRSVSLRLKSPRQAPEIKVYVEGVTVNKASLDGAPVLKDPHPLWGLSAYGLPAEGAEFRFEVAAGKPFLVRMYDRSYGLPASVPKRSADTVAEPLGMSDSVRAHRVLAFK